VIHGNLVVCMQKGQTNISSAETRGLLRATYSLMSSLPTTLSICGSTALCTLAASSVSQPFYTVGRTDSMDRGSAHRNAATYTEQHKHTKTHTDIHALSRIRTHDPSVQANEDSSCLRPCGHCDLHLMPYKLKHTYRRSSYIPRGDRKIRCILTN
jgi:hypothetical protein